MSIGHCAVEAATTPYCIINPSIRPSTPDEGRSISTTSSKVEESGAFNAATEAEDDAECDARAESEAGVEAQSEAEVEVEVKAEAAAAREAGRAAGAELRIDIEAGAHTAAADAHAGANQLTPADGTNTQVSSTSSAANECWICRAVGDEPLTKPCACRGSMTGVHASCVETWIQHHRRHTGTDEVPCCSVCKQPYRGEDLRPGLLEFVKRSVASLLKQALRSMFVVASLFFYWIATQPHFVLWLRVLTGTLSVPCFVYNTLVLTVSLHGQQPTGCLSCFYLDDFRVVIVVFAEGAAMIVIALSWFMFGSMHYGFLIPVALVLVVPLLVSLTRVRPWSFTCATIVTVVSCPMRVAVLIMIHVWNNPWRLVDPFDGVAHLCVPVTAIIFSWALASNIALVILLSNHSAIIVVCIMERAVWKRAKWKDGPIWWFLLQLAVLSVYSATLSFSGLDQISFLVLFVSIPWLILCCTLVLIVNWSLCVRTYRSWQHSNGQFVMSSSQSLAAATSMRASSIETAGP